jgi:hypothetical protein
MTARRSPPNHQDSVFGGVSTDAKAMTGLFAACAAKNGVLANSIASNSTKTSRTTERTNEVFEFTDIFYLL